MIQGRLLYKNPILNSGLNFRDTVKQRLCYFSIKVASTTTEIIENVLVRANIWRQEKNG